VGNRFPKKKTSDGWMNEYSNFIVEDTEKVDDLDATIVEGREVLKEIRRKMGRKPSHWASECFKCPIKAVNEWRSVRPSNEESETTYKVFQVGESGERDVKERYQSGGEVISIQFPIWIHPKELKHWISGMVDIVIQQFWTETDEKYGEIVKSMVVPIEVKTTKDFNEKFGYHAWKKFLPRKDHVAQLMIYMKAMGLKRGKIHYVNKNRQLDARYDIKFNKKFYDDVIQHYLNIEGLVAKKKDALKILDVLHYFMGYKKQKYPCIWFSPAKDHKEPVGSCPYYDRCKKAYDKKKKEGIKDGSSSQTL